jgi:hypothetical protein
MSSVISDRFSAIHDEITQWQKQDPKLNDKKGFIEYLKTCDIGQFNVGDARAKKRRITVAELVFDSRKRMSQMGLTYKKDRSEGTEQRVFELDEEERHELDEIDKRLKTYDPARVKRKEHES